MEPEWNPHFSKNDFNHKSDPLSSEESNSFTSHIWNRGLDSLNLNPMDWRISHRIRSTVEKGMHIPSRIRSTVDLGHMINVSRDQVATLKNKFLKNSQNKESKDYDITLIDNLYGSEDEKQEESQPSPKFLRKYSEDSKGHSTNRVLLKTKSFSLKTESEQETCQNDSNLPFSSVLRYFLPGGNNRSRKSSYSRSKSNSLSPLRERTDYERGFYGMEKIKVVSEPLKSLLQKVNTGGKEIISRITSELPDDISHLFQEEEIYHEAARDHTKRKLITKKIVQAYRSYKAQQKFSDFNATENFLHKYNIYGDYSTEARDLLYQQLELETDRILSKGRGNIRSKEAKINTKMEALQLLLKNMDMEELVEYMTRSKRESTEVQTFLKNCDQTELEPILKKITPELEKLIFEQYGNYVVQIGIERDSQFLDRVVELSLTDLKRFMRDQYSSRVLQKIASLGHKKFMDEALEEFKENFDFFIENLTNIIFSTKLVNNAKPAKLEFILKKIIENPQIIIKEPHMTRLMVSVFTRLKAKRIQEVFPRVKEIFWDLVNDKFGSYVLEKVIEKRGDSKELYLENIVVNNCTALIAKKNARLILFKLIEHDRNFSFCQKLVEEIIDSGGEFIKSKVLNKAETVNILFLSIMKVGMADMDSMMHYMSQLADWMLREFDTISKLSQCNFFLKKLKDLLGLF